MPLPNRRCVSCGNSFFASSRDPGLCGECSHSILCQHTKFCQHVPFLRMEDLTKNEEQQALNVLRKYTITNHFTTLLAENIDIVYSGTNHNQNRVVGVLVEVIPETRIHIEIKAASYEDYLQGKLSFLDLITHYKTIGLLTKQEGSPLKIKEVGYLELDPDILPLKDSYLPTSNT